MLFVFVPRLIPRQWVWVVLLPLVLCLSACVTHRERVGYYPHARPEDESVMDELRREFGWQKTPRHMASEPFYQRAARGVAETVSGWFQADTAPTEAQKLEEPPGQSEDARRLEESRRQFEQKHQEALRRLREQQGLSDE